MAGLLDTILGMSGQERTAALRQLGRDAEYYVPPELRGILGFLAEMTPSETLSRAGAAGREMTAPDRTAIERLGSAGQMLSETAGVAAPMMVAGRAAMPAAQALQEGLLGFSMAADDVGRRFADQLNQPDPVPTMYSGPSGFADYLKRVNPRGVRVAAEERPNLMMGDMYGMLPPNAKRVGKQDDITFYRGQDGDFYATAFNPDVGEQDVVGYIMPRGDMTELAVVSEMQGKGVGGELQYLFRKENPDAPTGGLTEAGEKTLRKTYERLSSEGLIGDTLPTPRNDAEAMAKQILEMRAAGRAGDVTEEMMAAADPQYMFYNTPLPMDEASRMERMKNWATSDVQYHGTGPRMYSDEQFSPNFSEFIPSQKGLLGAGVYVAPDVRKANKFAGAGEANRSDFDPSKAVPKGGSILPVVIRSENPASYGQMKDVQHKLDNVSGYIDLSKRGTEGLIDRGFTGVSAGNEETVFDPRNIRSIFARFDPEFAHLRNLSAGVGGLGLLSLMYPDQELQ